MLALTQTAPPQPQHPNKRHRPIRYRGTGWDEGGWTSSTQTFCHQVTARQNGTIAACQSLLKQNVAPSISKPPQWRERSRNLLWQGRGQCQTAPPCSSPTRGELGANSPRQRNPAPIRNPYWGRRQHNAVCASSRAHTSRNSILDRLRHHHICHIDRNASPRGMDENGKGFPTRRYRWVHLHLDLSDLVLARHPIGGDGAIHLHRRSPLIRPLLAPRHAPSERYNRCMPIASGTEFRTVEIPARDAHDGLHSTRVTLQWACPTCAGPRGDIVAAISYDGSRRLHCDGWTNPCGHVDGYASVRREAAISRVFR